VDALVRSFQTTEKETIAVRADMKAKSRKAAGEYKSLSDPPNLDISRMERPPVAEYAPAMEPPFAAGVVETDVIVVVVASLVMFASLF
jgi:hypothetical protein